MFKTRRGAISEGASQNEPIGRHNAHHVLDVTALNSNAAPIVIYTTAPASARDLLGTYPVRLSVACP